MKVPCLSPFTRPTWRRMRRCWETADWVTPKWCANAPTHRKGRSRQFPLQKAIGCPVKSLISLNLVGSASALNMSDSVSRFSIILVIANILINSTHCQAKYGDPIRTLPIRYCIQDVIPGNSCKSRGDPESGSILIEDFLCLITTHYYIESQGALITYTYPTQGADAF
jgi:hypothetical protein